MRLLRPGQQAASSTGSLHRRASAALMGRELAPLSAPSPAGAGWKVPGRRLAAAFCGLGGETGGGLCPNNLSQCRGHQDSKQRVPGRIQRRAGWGSPQTPPGTAGLEGGRGQLPTDTSLCSLSQGWAPGTSPQGSCDVMRHSLSPARTAPRCCRGQVADRSAPLSVQQH